jgi:hypothetical protein
MTTFINLTPHSVQLVTDTYTETFEPIGTVARVSTRTQPLAGFPHPFVWERYGRTENLPRQQPNTYLIVSGVVQDANPTRHDLVVPTGFVRDDAGRIVGCTAFRVSPLFPLDEV